MDLIARSVPTSQESAERQVVRRAAMRTNILRDNPNCEDGVKRVAPRLVARRDLSEWEGSEQLEGRRMAGWHRVARRALSSQKGVKWSGRRLVHRTAVATRPLSNLTLGDTK